MHDRPTRRGEVSDRLRDPDGIECSFRGTYLEIERPTRIVDTWLFEGWPDAEAVETVELQETDGVTTVKMNLAFRDQAGRDHMTTTDGQEDSWDGTDGGLSEVTGGSRWGRRRGLRVREGPEEEIMAVDDSGLPFRPRS